MKLKQSLLLKTLAFLLAVACLGTASGLAAYQVLNFEEVWGEDGPIYGQELSAICWDAQEDVQEMLDLYGTPSLSEYYENRLARLEEDLSAENTNLRWQVRSREDEVLYGNAAGDLPDTADLFCCTVRLDPNVRTVTTATLCWEACSYYAGGELVRCEDWRAQFAEDLEAYRNGDTSLELDRVYVDGELGTTEVLLVGTVQGETGYAPTLLAALEANEYGYIYDVYDGWTSQSGETGGDLILWLAEDLPVQDEVREVCLRLSFCRENRVLLAGGTVLLALLGLLLTVFLCLCAGYRRGRDGISLCWFHYVPGDLLLAAEIGIVILCILLLNSISWWNSAGRFLLMIGAVTACGAVIAALAVGYLTTFVARCKGRVLLRHSLIGWALSWAWRGLRAAGRALPLMWKAFLAAAVYLVVCLFCFVENVEVGLAVWLVLTLLLTALWCLWSGQWKQVRRGTGEIIGGSTDYKIDTTLMFPDLKAHAGQLNNLGQAIGVAVEERMRSEHFKAELITNVSHDLKTPLTSIINYVDLLKKEKLDNPKALEYIEVLDRKSQRLKKLTEDLVEASKASTGALTVNRERLDLLQLADQALAEYEHRLRDQGLTVVRTLPKEPVWVMADGRHMWRIMDNLLSNCGKYALPGTRIYVEVQTFKECARLSVKNISREELNIPAQELMERFVRGDQSRTEEGSGLGLSIARSLAELQGGTFDILVDGDLFKASVTLPKAEEE